MKEIKAIFITVFSALSGFLGVLYVPVLLMVLCNLIDYVTGLMATPNREEKLSSYKSIKGIFKKISMWLLVVVGAILDYLINYAGQMIGVKLPFSFLIGSIVAIWIVANEIISILENMIDIGVELPKFLLPLVKNIKEQADKAGEMETK